MGAEQKGQDSRADGDPNTCTWSDSAPRLETDQWVLVT